MRCSGAALNVKTGSGHIFDEAGWRRQFNDLPTGNNDSCFFPGSGGVIGIPGTVDNFGRMRPGIH